MRQTDHGCAPYVVAVLFVLFAVWIAWFHAPAGVPLPTCADAGACQYFQEAVQ